ncbi:MAG: hypothetical protein A2048_04530 [Deltaproteobacteria bacterium GWA2_45_12]|nr:MAG: hypothetical protein A2048_04530 [Deltaproteobacteria bacterium GWA2_45_12]
MNPQGKPWTQDSVAIQEALTRQGASPKPTSVGDQKLPKKPNSSEAIGPRGFIPRGDFFKRGLTPPNPLLL